MNKSKFEIHISVFQHGILQSNKIFSPSSASHLFTSTLLGRKYLSIGPSRYSSIYIPLAKLPSRLNLFKFSKTSIQVLLDPRFAGFLKTNKQSGDLSSFAQNPKAIRNVNSVLEPIECTLDVGSFGTIKFSEFEVLFKVKQHSRKTSNIKKSPIKYDTSIKTVAVDNYFTLLSVACVLFVAGCFLALAHRYNSSSILLEKSKFELNLSKNFVAPENIDFLNWMFGSSFNKDYALDQTFLVLTKFHLDWKNSLLTKKESAEILPLQSQFKRDYLFGNNSSHDSFSSWNAQIAKWRLGSIEKRNLNYNADEAALFSNNTRFSVLLAGGFAGSLSVQQDFLFEKLKLAREAILSMEKSRLEYIRTSQNKNSDEETSFLNWYSWKHAFKTNLSLFQNQFVNTLKDSQNYIEATIAPRQGIGIQSFWNSQSFQSVGAVFNLKRELSVANKEILPPPKPVPKPYLDLEDLDLLVLAKKEQLRSCYEMLLTRDRSAKGAIVWTWTILPNGQLKKVELRNTGINDKNFEKCLLARVRSWRFPKPVNGAITIEYPMKFNPLKSGEDAN